MTRDCSNAKSQFSVPIFGKGFLPFFPWGLLEVWTLENLEIPGRIQTRWINAADQPPLAHDKKTAAAYRLIGAHLAKPNPSGFQRATCFSARRRFFDFSSDRMLFRS
jgi:hypothetical protein